ncbi:hypothetical protein ACFV0T_20185 [Streptomyces sp. NPDC059582]|uniref:hypothetical protein n=1 Tax=Streptomyces sp. NPDC059582 TaxID=3346875 RepID=UPI0036C1214F
MNQRKNNYRAALQRDQAEPAPRTAKVTTLNSRFVRITIELEPEVLRNLDRWTAPAIALLATTCTTALHLLTVFTPPRSSSGADSRT